MMESNLMGRDLLEFTEMFDFNFSKLTEECDTSSSTWITRVGNTFHTWDVSLAYYSDEGSVVLDMFWNGCDSNQIKSITLEECVFHIFGKLNQEVLLFMTKNATQFSLVYPDTTWSLKMFRDVASFESAGFVHKPENILRIRANIKMLSPEPVPETHWLVRKNYKRLAVNNTFELVSTDGVPFYADMTLLETTSEYFKTVFETDGWKEKKNCRMEVQMTSEMLQQMMHFIYLNAVRDDVCDYLPVVLDTAQMWLLSGMKKLIEKQMIHRIRNRTEETDTDMAAEYLDMAVLYDLKNVKEVCCDVLAENFSQFYDSAICKEFEQNNRELMKIVWGCAMRDKTAVEE